MTDADAFLDAIWAAPEDDTPRLVYADWLEEHGQEAYGEFIRLQCALARLPRASPEAAELWRRIQPVWRVMEGQYALTGAEEWPVPSNYGYQHLDAIHFHRGCLRPRVGVFLSRLWRSCGLWWPWCPAPDCWLDVSGATPDHLAGCELLRRVRRLHLVGWDAGSLPELLAAGLGALLGTHAVDLTHRAVSSNEVAWLVDPGLPSSVREVTLLLHDEEGYYRAHGEPLPDYLVPARELRGYLEGRYERAVIHTEPV